MENGQLVDVLGTGTCEIGFGSGVVLILTNVIYAPEIVYNLIRIYKLTECKHKLHFEHTNALVKCDTGVIFYRFINGIPTVLRESIFVPGLLNADVASKLMK